MRRWRPGWRGKKLLAVAEDAFGAGCVGQRTAAILAQHGQAPEKLVLINLGKTFLPEGTVPQLEHQAGIDAAGHRPGGTGGAYMSEKNGWTSC